MKRGLYILSIVLGILLIGFVSAGFWSTITGKAGQQTEQVYATVLGTNPVNVTVDNSSIPGAGAIPAELGSTASTVYATVCDPDGVSDINDTAITVTFINGSTTRFRKS